MKQVLNHLYALWGMSRPMQLLAVILVYILGALVAKVDAAPFDAVTFSGGLIVLLLVAASIHYANEYADYETDTLTARTPFSGGSGALMRVDVSRRVALQAAWVALGGGVILAAFYVTMGQLSPIAFVILLAGAWGGWMYSLPPLQLAWRGWGELDNAFLGGMLLPLYGYAVQSGGISLVVALRFLPFMLLVFLNLLATTWPDRTADAHVGKLTLATRWPISRLRRLYVIVAVVAFVAMLLSGGAVLPFAVVLGSLGVFPVVGWAAFTYTRMESPHWSVFAMVLLLLLQMGTWVWVCLGG